MEEMRKDIQEHGTTEFPLITLIQAIKKSPLLVVVSDLRPGSSKGPMEVTKMPRTRRLPKMISDKGDSSKPPSNEPTDMTQDMEEGEFVRDHNPEVGESHDSRSSLNINDNDNDDSDFDDVISDSSSSSYKSSSRSNGSSRVELRYKHLRN